MTMLSRRSLAGTAVAIAVAGLSLTACSSSSDSGSHASPTPPGPTPAAAMTQSDPALAGLVGPDCDSYAAQVPTGSGSLQGMSQDPLVTAVGHNPMLTQATAALSGRLNKNVNLASTLNGGPFTVFAPVDSAFRKLPAATLNTLRSAKGTQALVSLLTYHVVAGQLSAAKVAGTQMSVANKPLKITRAGNTIKVNGATVLCGGIRTASGTLYLIDTVLTVPKK